MATTSSPTPPVPGSCASVRAGSLLDEPGDPFAKRLGLDPECLADVDERERPSAVVGGDPFRGAANENGLACVDRASIAQDELDRVAQDREHEPLLRAGGRRCDRAKSRAPAA